MSQPIRVYTAHAHGNAYSAEFTDMAEAFKRFDEERAKPTAHAVSIEVLKPKAFWVEGAEFETAAAPTPFIGQMVHYQSHGSADGKYQPEPRAAIVTEVSEFTLGAVGLCVLNPTGQFFNQHVEFAEEPTPGHWNFPPVSEATIAAQTISRELGLLATGESQQ